MGMFDDVVINAKAAANAISKKAGNLYDISKLKYNVSNIKGEIHKKCRELGELMYHSKYVAPVSQEKIDALLEEIKTLHGDLDDVNELLAAAKNLIICPACGSIIASDSVFCSKCGIKVDPQGKETSSEKSQEEPDGQPQKTQAEPAEEAQPAAE